MGIVRSYRKSCFEQMSINISVISVLINILTTKNPMMPDVGLDYRKGKLDRVIIRGIWRKKEDTHPTSSSNNISLTQ